MPNFWPPCISIQAQMMDWIQWRFWVSSIRISKLLILLILSALKSWICLQYHQNPRVIQIILICGYFCLSMHWPDKFCCYNKTCPWFIVHGNLWDNAQYWHSCPYAQLGIHKMFWKIMKFVVICCILFPTVNTHFTERWRYSRWIPNV